jgi:hypothetical protein
MTTPNVPQCRIPCRGAAQPLPRALVEDGTGFHRGYSRGTQGVLKGYSQGYCAQLLKNGTDFLGTVVPSQARGQRATDAAIVQPQPCNNNATTQPCHNTSTCNRRRNNATTQPCNNNATTQPCHNTSKDPTMPQRSVHLQNARSNHGTTHHAPARCNMQRCNE